MPAVSEKVRNRQYIRVSLALYLMTKFLVSLAVITSLLSGCNPSSEKRSSALREGAPVSRFRIFLQELDTTDVQTVSLAITQYGKLLAPAPKDSCDAAFVLLEAYCRREALVITRFLQKDTARYAPLVARDEWGVTKELNTELAGFSERLRENGYRVIVIDNKMTAVQDWDLMAARVSRFVSPVVNEYIAQVNKEAKESVKLRYRVAVTPEELVDKIMWREQFDQQNKSFILHEEVKESQRQLFTFMLKGSDTSFFRQACFYLNTRFPGSAVNKLVNPYFKAVQEHNSTFAANLLARYYQQGYISADY